MNIVEAWEAVGGSAEAVFDRARRAGDTAARAAVLRASVEEARRLARTMMARHHPDKNPGDAGAASRFVRVQEALRLIEHETAEFERKAANRAEEQERRRNRDGLIIIR